MPAFNPIPLIQETQFNMFVPEVTEGKKTIKPGSWLAYNHGMACGNIGHTGLAENK